MNGKLTPGILESRSQLILNSLHQDGYVVIHTVVESHRKLIVRVIWKEIEEIREKFLEYSHPIIDVVAQLALEMKANLDVRYEREKMIIEDLRVRLGQLESDKIAATEREKAFYSEGEMLRFKDAGMILQMTDGVWKVVWRMPKERA